MADAHTRFRFTWLEGVQSDRGVTPSAFSVAFALAWHMNKTRGDAWPSRDALAERTGLSVRQVTEHLKTLQARGHIEARRRPNSSTVYLFKSRSDVPSTAVPDVRRTAGPRRPDGRFDVVRSGGEPQFRMCGEPQPNPLNVNPLKEPIEGERANSDLLGGSPEPRQAIAVVAKAKAAKLEGSRLVPPSWTPPDNAYEFGASLGLTSAEVDMETAEFRDHEFRRPYTHWDLTWRRWIRRAAKPRSGGASLQTARPSFVEMAIHDPMEDF